MRLGIGTVQFGMRYGVAHRGGRPGPEVAVRVLRQAHAAGVRLLDTAPLYGDAHEVLASVGPLLGSFDVVTKTVRYVGVERGVARARCAVEGFRNSLRTLGLECVYGLLEHQPFRWLEPGGERIYEALVAEREAGRVAKIGVSALGFDQLAEIVDRFPLDLVQLPLNAIDQRAVATGMLAELAARGVEVHARSAFLQGALLADPDALASAPHLVPTVRAFRRVARERGLAVTEAALGFVRSTPGVSAVVVGVQQPAQLEGVLRAFDTSVDPAWFASVASAEPAVVDPSTWSVEA